MGDIRTYKAGEVIVYKGTPAKEAFLILKGHVQVFIEKGGRTVKLADLEIGSIFGESALFEEGEDYGASIKATEDTEVAVLQPETFKEKVDACDPFIKTIIHTLIDRQRDTNETLLSRETQEYMELDLVDITDNYDQD